MSAVHLHVVELEGDGERVRSRVTSKVFVSVTIGMDDFIHNSNACARLVFLGSISCFIVLLCSRLCYSESTAVASPKNRILNPNIELAVRFKLRQDI